MTLCTFGDGASNQGTFGETLNLAALWRLPVVFMVTNNQFGMGTSLARHSAVTDLQRKGESLGVPGTRCDGMDVLDTHAASRGRGARARRPPTAARRGRDLPLSRSFDGRPRGVPHARRRSRSGARATRSRRLASCWNARGSSTGTTAGGLDGEAVARVETAVAVLPRPRRFPRTRVALRGHLRARRASPWRVPLMASCATARP